MRQEGIISIESGRMVVVPKQRPPSGPMADACQLHPVPAGRLFLTASYSPVPGHPGTAELQRICISPTVPHRGSQSHFLLAHAPFLVLGDHSFVYTRTPGAKSEPGRALRACAGSRRSGTYRSDSTDVGACLRTGWRRATYAVRQLADQTIECLLMERDDEEDEEGAIT